MSAMRGRVPNDDGIVPVIAFPPSFLPHTPNQSSPHPFPHSHTLLHDSEIAHERENGGKCAGNGIVGQIEAGKLGKPANRTINRSSQIVGLGGMGVGEREYVDW